MIKPLQQRWKAILSITAGIVTFLGAFILPPPFYLGSKVATEAGRFVVAIVIGLLLVPIAIYPARRKNVQRWVTSSILSAVVALCALFLFWNAESAWIRYAYDRTFVIGTHLTADAQAHIRKEARKGRILTGRDDELIGDYATATERIWPRPEITLHQLELVACYLLAIAACAATIVSVLQAGLSAAAGKKQ